MKISFHKYRTKLMTYHSFIKICKTTHGEGWVIYFPWFGVDASIWIESAKATVQS